MSDKMQIVTLVTTDGRRLVFSGRDQIDPDNAPQIVKIEVTHPMRMPDGCKFEAVSETVTTGNTSEGTNR